MRTSIATERNKMALHTFQTLFEKQVIFMYNPSSVKRARILAQTLLTPRDLGRVSRKYFMTEIDHNT